MTTAGYIINIASAQLEDLPQVRWFPDTLISYLNMAIREIITMKPDAFATTQNQQLVAGIAQPLPSGVIDLVDVTYNMDYTGLIHLSAVNSIPKDRLDHLIPDWPTWPPNSIVSYNVIDSNDPKNWFTFPPQPAGTTAIVETIITLMPTLLAATNDTFPLDDSYVNPAINFIVSKALSEPQNNPALQQKSAGAYNLFLQQLGLKTNAEQRNVEVNK